MKYSCEKKALSKQKSSNPLRLDHDVIRLNPAFPVTPADPYMHAPNITVTGLHWHETLEIGYCYEGSGVFLVERSMDTFFKGDTSLIFPREIHIARSHADSGSQWRFIHIDPIGLLGRRYPEYERQLRLKRGSLPYVFRSGAEDDICLLVKNLIHASCVQNPEGQMLVQGLVMCLLARLSQISGNPDAKQDEPSQLHGLSPAIERMLSHYMEPLSISELAAQCGMSLSTYQRTFQRAMGIPPGRYLHQLRIRMSCLLLMNTDMPILEVSEKVGYDSLSSYNRQFRQFIHMTPREYRTARRFAL